MITATGITKNYQRGAESFAALKGVSLNINEGDFICLLGPSGAGKTTLLNILGCMDAPADGDLVIAGQKVVTSGRRQLTDAKLDRFRRKHIGFILTDFFLIPSLTALENVEMPLLWSGKPNRERAKELLASVNMDHRLNHRPTELSGGEMQRVAIARALVNNPRILLADEPTGNLDTKTRDTILDLFDHLNQQGLTIVLATHDHEIAERVTQVVRLNEGRLEG